MIKENIKLALLSLKMNKLRTILTMLGIIIGIMSITSIMFIGKAMSASVSKEISSLGSRNISLALQKKDSQIEYFDEGIVSEGAEHGMSLKPTTDDLISDDMIEDLQSIFPDEIEGISLNIRKGQSKAKNGDYESNISVLGVSNEYVKANSINLISGSFISELDVKNKTNSVVVSDLFIRDMFQGENDVLDKVVKVYSKDSIEVFQIIGVYKHENNNQSAGIPSENNITTEFYIPISTAKEDMIEKNYSNITIIGKEEKTIEILTKQLQKYFDDLYQNNDEWKVSVTNMASVISMVNGTLKKISMAITAIAGISLVVGGVGVMNVMLISVTERTREIGTKKALGAKEKHIKLQFVIEATIISFIGGVIGLLLGIGIGIIISLVFSVTFILSPWLVISSIFFSTSIGALFGYYPAKKASKLNPIDALRYE